MDKTKFRESVEVGGSMTEEEFYRNLKIATAPQPLPGCVYIHPLLLEELRSLLRVEKQKRKESK